MEISAFIATCYMESRCIKNLLNVPELPKCRSVWCKTMLLHFIMPFPRNILSTPHSALILSLIQIHFLLKS